MIKRDNTFSLYFPAFSVIVISIYEHEDDTKRRTCRAFKCQGMKSLREYYRESIN